MHIHNLWRMKNLNAGFGAAEFVQMRLERGFVSDQDNRERGFPCSLYGSFDIGR